MQSFATFVALYLLSGSLFADDHIVQFDSRFDFAKVRTFTIRDAKLHSARTELSNALVSQNLTQTVRMILTARGLAETSATPDILVEFSLDSHDYSIGPGGRANRANDGRRGRRSDPVSWTPPDFSEAALVVDIIAKAQPELLIWRGVYRDTEKNVSKLVEKLPDDARKLLADYPPKGGQ